MNHLVVIVDGFLIVDSRFQNSSERHSFYLVERDRFLYSEHGSVPDTWNQVHVPYRSDFVELLITPPPIPIDA